MFMSFFRQAAQGERRSDAEAQQEKLQQIDRHLRDAFQDGINFGPIEMVALGLR